MRKEEERAMYDAIWLRSWAVYGPLESGAYMTASQHYEANEIRLLELSVTDAPVGSSLP
jgi:hypothetical protein